MRQKQFMVPIRDRHGYALRLHPLLPRFVFDQTGISVRLLLSLVQSLEEECCRGFIGRT